MRVKLLGSPAIAVRSGPEGAAPSHRPKALWVLVAMLGLVAAGGFYGGIAFVADPTGASIGAKPSWLTGSPVSDFLLPGFFLLTVYGIGGLVLIAGLIWRSSFGLSRRLDRSLNHHWAWVGSVVYGGVLVAWIVYELMVLPETTFLQPALIVIGLAIAMIPFLPSLRHRYEVSSDTRRWER